MQVIVLPIFWNSREDEKERVLKAAELAVQLLHDAALDATLDTDDTHTPGQRMKFWCVASFLAGGMHRTVVWGYLHGLPQLRAVTQSPHLSTCPACL